MANAETWNRFDRMVIAAVVLSLPVCLVVGLVAIIVLFFTPHPFSSPAFFVLLVLSGLLFIGLCGVLTVALRRAWVRLAERAQTQPR